MDNSNVLKFAEYIQDTYINGPKRNILDDFINSHEPFCGVITFTYIPKKFWSLVDINKSYIYTICEIDEFEKIYDDINDKCKKAVALYKEFKNKGQKIYLFVFVYMVDVVNSIGERHMVLWIPDE
ncbi:hypothetical protein Catovirus_1_10 [Catovirus CTV1]|uniref:Uncharacterized protein n=1 Tax=Catovirus CTV1 TaxID=1977631 RepID=A0A1V0S8C7_9VIRU|nr:hypothetical protein Catovirus_1_10 [Catovirus CTV1]